MTIIKLRNEFSQTTLYFDLEQYIIAMNDRMISRSWEQNDINKV